MKDTVIKWGITALVTVLALCIPVGLYMGFSTGDAKWLILCAPLLMFLS